jgi:hypothetical protein
MLSQKTLQRSSLLLSMITKKPAAAQALAFSKQGFATERKRSLSKDKPTSELITKHEQRKLQSESLKNSFLREKGE